METISGLICFRYFRILNNHLYSLREPVRWSMEMESDVIPNEINTHGLYAYLGRPGIQGDYPVLGEVECSGRIVQHSDGVIRAQHMTIRQLFVSDVNLVEVLKREYGIMPLIDFDEWYAFAQYSIAEHNKSLEIFSKAIQFGIEDPQPISFGGISNETGCKIIITRKLRAQQFTRLKIAITALMATITAVGWVGIAITHNPLFIVVALPAFLIPTMWEG